ncbi:MAG: helix-turn-helix transcriptional regulator [Oscillospiraceae bacterium]
MNVKICGAFSNRAEHESFHMKLDCGEPLYLFLHFHNPVAIVINGETVVTKNDACIIYSPGTPQDYFALKGGFVNDYVKFIVSDDKYITCSGLPVNEIFYIENTYKLNEQIGCITWALTDVLNDHRNEMEKTLDEIINELKNNRVFASPKNRRDSMMSARLIKLRNDVSNDPAAWSVEKMARTIYMTRSHFSGLYTKQFGVTPGSDLLDMKMDLAKRLLLTTELNVGEIAEKCGYQNSENFIRGFKNKFGVTPLKFRKVH